MQSRNLRRAVNSTSRALATGRRGYSSFDRDFYNLASAITGGFDTGLRRRTSPWDFFERCPSVFYEPVVYRYQPVRSTYEQKTITTDETGRVVVKTQRKVPGRPWETYIEEYANDKTLEQSKKPEAIGQSQQADAAKPETASQQQQATEQPAPESNKTTNTAVDNTSQAKNDTVQNTSSKPPTTQPSQSISTNMLSLFDQHLQELSNSMMRDFDHFFGVRHPFSNSRWLEPETDMAEIGDNATYHAKTVVNDNGRVTVKTVSKQPGSAWETSVKHYGKDNVLEGSQQKVESIDNASAAESKTGKEIEEAIKESKEENVDQVARE